MSPQSRDPRRGQAVVALLRSLESQVRLADGPADQLPGLLRALRYHRVAAVVQSVAPPALAAALAADVADRFANQLASAADLSFLRGVLDDRAQRWVAMKGPDLESFYPSGVQRDYSDLDVLVARDDLPGVLSSLGDSGCRLVGDPWPHLQASERGQLLLRLPAGSLLDLHWELFNNPGVRRALPVQTSDLLARRTMRQGLPALDLADTVMFVTAHACLSGGYRLKWILDVHRVVGAHGAWLDAVQRWATTPLALPMAVSLDRALDVLGPLPGVGPAALPNSAWRSWLRQRQHAQPVQDALGRRTGRTVTAATRGGTAASARTLLHGAWAVQRRRVRSQAERPLGGREQEAFLAWVTAAG